MAISEAKRMVQVGPYKVGDGQRPLVIAEAGINHNGHLDIAIELIKAARHAGADIVKFQTHIADAEMLPDTNVASDAGSHVTRSLYEIMHECYLSYEDHLRLQEVADQEQILFLSTPFSVEAVDLLESVGMPAYKIGSGEITNIPLVEYICQKKKPILLSTGTATFEEVRRTMEVVQSFNAEVILMQCTSNYPTAYSDVNLAVIDKMRQEFAVPVGLSDHCQGNFAAFGAIARGACLIEKHFTLSRHLPGVDQTSSLEPQEMEELVVGVKAVYDAMGDSKVLNEEALKVRQGFSESIVTIRSVKAGELFEAHENLWVKRPGSGIPSYDLMNIVGRRAARDLPPNYLLRPEDIEG